MILRLAWASLRRRGQQLFLVFAAVLVAASACAGLAALAARGRAAVTQDVRSFGPNLLVRPAPGVGVRLAPDSVAHVRAVAGVEAASAVVELPLSAAHAAAVFAADAEVLRLHPHWQVEPRWPRAGEFALGARRDGPPGAVARVTTGEPALDGAVFVPLSDLPAEIAGVDRIEVRAAPARLEEIARQIEARVPGGEARALARVSAAEVHLLRRVEWLLACAGGISLALAVASVAASTAALVGERRRELALMLALGHPLSRLLGLLSLELLVAAGTAAILGELAGEAGAAVLARRLLGEGAMRLSPGGAVAAAAVAALVVLAGLGVALRRIARVEPATVLRGD